MKSDPVISSDASRAEQALAALLRVAVDASPVCITISDLRRDDAPLIFVNDQFCRTTGHTREQVIGRNCRFLQGEGTDRSVVARMREAIARREPVSIELISYKRTGEPFLNRLDLAPVRDSRLEIDAYVGVQRDITAFRAAEATRREREKMEALGRLASGFSHELNNLLQPIITYGGMLAARPEMAEAEYAEQINTIVDCASAARDITAQVLHFARSGVALSEAEPLSRRRGEAIRMASRLLPPGVSLSIEGVEDLSAACTIDTAELLQVLGNLFRNAANAMDGKGSVRLAAVMEDTTLVLSVSDTGPGVPPELWSRIFEPFFSTKPPGQGTGLGLATAWGIVRGWGGTLTVRNREGGGAEFIIRIPLDRRSTDCGTNNNGAHSSDR